MDTRLLIFVMSLAAAVSGLTIGEVIPPERWVNKVEDMQFCLNQENVTEAEMKEFLINKQGQDENEPLKMAILCFLKRINFFDGVSWNTKVIAESEGGNPKMLKLINDCLEKDDVTLAPQERSYRAQKCVLENGVLEQF